MLDTNSPVYHESNPLPLSEQHQFSVSSEQVQQTAAVDTRADATQPHHPRPLTDSEADEVRSHNLDPTGMTIDADLPETRPLTSGELQELSKQGVDTNALAGKPVVIGSIRSPAALKQLISNAEQVSTPTPANLKHAYIWMDSFLGTPNMCILADAISMKTESLTFNLLGHIYNYSGHYTVMLNAPRHHESPYFGFGTAPTAQIVNLEDVGGEMMPLQNATIWEQGNGFIDVTAMGKEWIYSGNYTIRN